MYGCNGSEVVVDGGEMEGDPCSPAVASGQPFAVSLRLEVVAQLLILGVDIWQLLPLDDLEKFRDVLNGAGVRGF